MQIVLDELSAGAERPFAQRDYPGGMVETAAHMALARAAGCDLAQGAAFGAAVAAEDVPQLLSTLRKAAFHRA